MLLAVLVLIIGGEFLWSANTAAFVGWGVEEEEDVNKTGAGNLRDVDLPGGSQASPSIMQQKSLSSGGSLLDRSHPAKQYYSTMLDYCHSNS